MNNFLDFIQMNNSIIIIAFAIIIIFLLILLINLDYRLRQLSSKYNRFMKNSDAQNIEELLKESLTKLEKLEEKEKIIFNNIDTLEHKLSFAVQKCGVVRYNAFEDMGGNLCFAIALLDAHNNGFVLNGLHNREGSYVYAKPVHKGASDHQLSSEEIDAIQKAIDKK